MKPCVMALALGALGVLTIQATPVTEITGGTISRSYSYIGSSPSETDSLTLNGSSGGVDFRILLLNMADSFPPYYGVTAFTDHVSASVILLMNCPGSCDPTPGSLDLDVTSFLSNAVGPYPGPNSSSGLFSTSGSFTAPGINILLTGVGTTNLGLTTLFDPDPGFFFYGPSFFQYTFVPAPEPAVMVSTGLGLLALILARRRTGNRSRPPRRGRSRLLRHFLT